MGEIKGYITNSDEKGSVNISEDVISVIAAAAATEVEGVHGLFASHGKDITQMLTRKSLSKGIKITRGDGIIAVDVYIMADIGFSVNAVGENVQKAVINAIEAAAGLTISAVNVHVCGITLKKA